MKRFWSRRPIQQEIVHGGLRIAGLEGFRRAHWMRMVLPKQGAALLPAVRDVGEAAVSALARERGSSLVLVEERKARQVARAVYGLQPIGSARILIAAKRKNLLAGIAGPLAELRREGFWIHQDIVRVAVREAGERGSENQAQLICRNAR